MVEVVGESRLPYAGRYIGGAETHRRVQEPDHLAGNRPKLAYDRSFVRVDGRDDVGGVDVSRWIAIRDLLAVDSLF